MVQCVYLCVCVFVWERELQRCPQDLPVACLSCLTPVNQSAECHSAPSLWELMNCPSELSVQSPLYPSLPLIHPSTLPPFLDSWPSIKKTSNWTFAFLPQKHSVTPINTPCHFCSQSHFNFPPVPCINSCSNCIKETFCQTAPTHYISFCVC